MNIEKLKTLRDYLKTGGHLSIEFHTLYGGDFKVLGLDEFPHDREYVKSVFELTDRDFDFLFTPASFIHLKDDEN